MKYIKKYETLGNSQFKKYIITRVKSDVFGDIYINLYENLFYTENKHAFRCIYYYDENDNKIAKFENGKDIYHLNPQNIMIYQTDDLEDAINELNIISNLNKYNL